MKISVHAYCKSNGNYIHISENERLPYQYSRLVTVNKIKVHRPAVASPSNQCIFGNHNPYQYANHPANLNT